MKLFEVGSRVVEPTYGLGSVIAVENGFLRIDFDEHGVKKFMISLSQLEPSSEPTPEKSRKTRRRRKATKASAAKK